MLMWCSKEVSNVFFIMCEDLKMNKSVCKYPVKYAMSALMFFKVAFSLPDASKQISKCGLSFYNKISKIPLTHG